MKPYGCRIQQEDTDKTKCVTHLKIKITSKIKRYIQLYNEILGYNFLYSTFFKQSKGLNK